ncbi:radical SAM/SPASM domain-containing protein [Vallitalea maricola]|uniref:Radical SAM protein n=1 Tax=Vallitalea maricola TaxID=3074433 RepID=A0ACB5UK28_9FIRM|nr:radical SAM protein [Vallitalea sp. AN17-2]
MISNIDSLNEEDIVNDLGLNLEKIEMCNNSVKGKRLGGLIFNVIERCNLACSYCMVSKGTYDSNNAKEQMTEDDCIKTFLTMLDNYEDGVSLICFFGGEPMLNYKTIEATIKRVDEICEDRKIIPPKYSIITNGTIMNEQIIDFLNEHNISISISIDGLKELHDTARVFINGKGSFDKIKENLVLLKEYGRQFPLYAECTIHKKHLQNKGHLREWGYHYTEELYNLGFDTVYIFPVDSKDPEYSVEDEKDLEDLAEFYKGIYDYYIELLLDDEMSAMPPAHFLGVFINLITKRYNKFCRAGYGTVFTNPEGEFYPCHLFYQRRHHQIGNINNGLDLSKDKMEYLIRENNRNHITECKKCVNNKLCFLWCAGSSLISNGSINSVIKSRCFIVDFTIDYVIKKLMELRRNKSEMEVFKKNIRICSAYFKRGKQDISCK